MRGLGEKNLTAKNADLIKEHITNGIADKREADSLDEIMNKWSFAGAGLGVMLFVTNPPILTAGVTFEKLRENQMANIEVAPDKLAVTELSLEDVVRTYNNKLRGVEAFSTDGKNMIVDVNKLNDLGIKWPEGKDVPQPQNGKVTLSQ